MIRRAKAGGETVGGKAFKGGQFIGAEYIALENGLNINKIQRAVDKAVFENIRSAAFAISRTAKASIKTSSSPSLPGEPPTTRGRGGKNLRGAIFTNADRETAVIGPRYSYVGDVGEAHEFGKSRKGDDFPERPFMGPALEENVSRFARDWQGSIGE